MKLTAEKIRFDRSMYIGDGKRRIPPIRVTIYLDEVLPRGTYGLEVLLKGPDGEGLKAYATLEVT